MTVFPKVAGIEGTRSARQIRTAGAIHAGYSTVTDYPLGIVRALPYKAHLALDELYSVDFMGVRIRLNNLVVRARDAAEQDPYSQHVPGRRCGGHRLPLNSYLLQPACQFRCHG